MVSFLLSAIWQAILGCFGISTERKLGRAEEDNKTLEEANKDYKHELEIKAKPIGDLNSTIDRL